MNSLALIDAVGIGNWVEIKSGSGDNSIRIDRTVNPSGLSSIKRLTLLRTHPNPDDFIIPKNERSRHDVIQFLFNIKTPV